MGVKEKQKEKNEQYEERHAPVSYTHLTLPTIA